MKKLGIFVGENNWTFFEEIYRDLATDYQTMIFKPKVYQIPVLHEYLNHIAFHSTLRSMLKTNDICFFEWASDLLMHATSLPKHARIVTRLHSFELYEWAPKINWDAVDKVICVSYAMQQMFCELYPKQAYKTVVVYNGRSLEKFHPPLQKNFQFNLGMLCYIAPIKRVYETILMFYNLKRLGYATHLYIGGREDDARYARATRRLVEQLNLQESVIFDGQINNPERWLQKIDVFISNSFWEGQQVALLEAMASGCYCLSHYWSGAEEMLPNQNLFITEAELQQKIINYAELPDAEKAQHQDQLRTLACERFNIAQTKAQIRAVLAEQAGLIT